MGLGNIVKTILIGPIVATLCGGDFKESVGAMIGASIVGVATVAGFKYLLTRKDGQKALKPDEQEAVKEAISKKTEADESDEVQLKLKSA